MIRQRSVSAKIAAAISSIIHGAAAMNAMATPPRCSRRINRLQIFTPQSSLKLMTKRAVWVVRFCGEPINTLPENT